MMAVKLRSGFDCHPHTQSARPASNTKLSFVTLHRKLFYADGCLIQIYPLAVEARLFAGILALVSRH